MHKKARSFAGPLDAIVGRNNDLEIILNQQTQFDSLTYTHTPFPSSIEPPVAITS